MSAPVSKEFLRAALNQRAPGMGETIDSFKAKFNARLVALEIGKAGDPNYIAVGAVDFWRRETERCHPYVHAEVAKSWKEIKAEVAERAELERSARKSEQARAKGRGASAATRKRR